MGIEPLALSLFINYIVENPQLRQTRQPPSGSMAPPQSGQEPMVARRDSGGSTRATLARTLAMASGQESTWQPFCQLGWGSGCR